MGPVQQQFHIKRKLGAFPKARWCFWEGRGDLSNVRTQASLKTDDCVCSVARSSARLDRSSTFGLALTGGLSILLGY